MKEPKQKNCIECGKLFNQYNSLTRVCSIECSIKNAKAKSKKEVVKKWKTEKKAIKEKLMTKIDYLNIAQKVFNTYIRLRDKGKPCISCNAVNYTSSCGHYYSSGKHKNVTFNELNCHAQCWFYCNSSLSGNLIEYRKGLIQRIGLDNLDYLDSIAKIEKKFEIDELKEIIKEYKEKIKQLKK